MDLSVQQKVKEAERYKNLGNQFFKAKEFKKAMSNYHQANLFLAGLQEEGSQYYSYSKQLQIPKELLQYLKEVKFSVYMNMAQIYIYDSKFQKAYDILKKASLIKQTEKLVYRKAIVELNLKEFDLALKNFNKVLEYDSSPEMKQDIESKIKQLKQKQKEYDNNLSKKFKKMFV